MKKILVVNHEEKLVVRLVELQDEKIQEEKLEISLMIIY
jgi:hypothetical protein